MRNQPQSMTEALEDALADLRAEVEGGRILDVATKEIAAEHGLNPILLGRKFVERFGSIAALIERRTLAKATAHPEIDYEKVRALIEYQCKKYRVKSDKFFPLRGKSKITITSRLVGNQMIHVEVDFYECAVVERVVDVGEGLESWWETARTKL